MLKKLMKHEFRATGRTMLPFYVLVLVSALCGNLSMRSLMDSDSTFLSILGGLLTAFFVLSLFAMCIATPVLMVWRFHKNLLGDEGYLMMTLPVSVHQQVWSKLLVSAVWTLTTLVVLIGSVFLLVMDLEGLSYTAHLFFKILHSINAEMALNGVAFCLELLVLGFFASCTLCLQCYASMSIGHSFANHKVLWSIGIYLAIQFLLQLLGSTLLITAGDVIIEKLLSMVSNASPYWGPHFSMMGLILSQLIYGAVFYVITVWFLRNKLNLE